MEIKYIALIIAGILLVFIVGRLISKLTWGDPGTDAAATECREIAWKLNVAQSEGHGDPEALKKFDHFWVLVTKHSLNHDTVAVASLKTVLRHACKAYEKAYPGNTARKQEADGYFTSMNSVLADYAETQESKFLSA